jgi:hypothetical protein
MSKLPSNGSDTRNDSTPLKIGDQVTKGTNMELPHGQRRTLNGFEQIDN